MLGNSKNSVTSGLAVLAGLGLLWTTAASGAGQTGETGDVARALVGAIDIHVHSLPDDRPRSIDAVDVAKLAGSRKMRAIVLKNHYESTAGLVYMVRKAVPGHRGVRRASTSTSPSAASTPRPWST